ncbi:flagellar hook-length control protein FliK [Salipiger pacificus]|nr:flagellar hook-length control protein FliK [Alloyangia pacifica]MCA0947437.1 flagellar hook-length control protein FliK [Alloyangia pacifica]
MINILTAFGGAGATNGATAEKPAEGETSFAGLLALLGGGNEPPDEGAGAAPGELGEMLADAEAALADPDLSEEEIAAIVGPLISQLGAALAADPALLERAEALIADLSVSLGAEGAAGEISWRDLSEGLAELQALLGGADEIEGEGAALAELLGQAIDLAEEIVQPFVPVVSGMGQLLSFPLRGEAAGEDVEGAGQTEAAMDLAADLQEIAEEGPEAARALVAQTDGKAPDGQRAAALSLAADTPAAQAGILPTEGSVSQLQAMPLAPVSATPVAASGFAAAQIAAGSPQLAVQGQDVLGQIRASAGAEGEINVELKPEGLGKVEISLTPAEAGKLQVVVRADQAAVLASLRSDRDGLLALLRDAGHAVDDGSLSFSDMGAQNGSQNGRQAQDGGRTGGYMTYGTASAEASSLDGAASHSRLLPEGSVDISI